MHRLKLFCITKNRCVSSSILSCVLPLWATVVNTLKSKKKKLKKKSKNPKSMPFVIFRGDHLRSTSGITCGSGSFAVQFGDHFRSGDHFQSGYHLRRCTVLTSCSSLIEAIVKQNKPNDFH